MVPNLTPHSPRHVWGVETRNKCETVVFPLPNCETAVKKFSKSMHRPNYTRLHLFQCTPSQTHKFETAVSVKPVHCVCVMYIWSAQKYYEHAASTG